MTSTNYLKLGLTALSVAGSRNWVVGHYGAGVLAAKFLLDQFPQKENISSMIHQRVNEYVEKHPALFGELEDSPIDPDWKAKILEGISLNLKHFRTVGHGIIYGTLALKALLEDESLAQKNIIQGITDLLTLSSQERLNRFYGIGNYDLVKVEASDKIIDYGNSTDMIKASFAELIESYPDQSIGEDFYFFTGAKLHIVTHAHALIMLEEMGFKNLAEQGYQNHRLHIKLARQTPPNPNKLKLDTSYEESSYWSDSNKDPHHIKLPYSTFALLEILDQEAKNQYESIALKFLGSRHLTA